jgi:hypothetical protein
VKLLLLLFVISNSNAIADSYDPTDDLMAAFGSRCSSQGDATNVALAQSGSIKGIVSAIKKDDSCGNLVPLLDSFDSELAASLNNRSRANDRYSEQVNVVDDLRNAIAAEQAKGAGTDGNYVTELQTELYSSQIQLLKLKEANRFQGRDSNYKQCKKLSDPGEFVT